VVEYCHREVVISSLARTSEHGRVKPIEIASECFFVKRVIVRIENRGSLGYDLKHGGQMSLQAMACKESSLLKAIGLNLQSFTSNSDVPI
jgi:hypothetical protein